MITQEHPTSATSTKQYATFYLCDLLIGLPIESIQEINRQLDVTRVPHSPAIVRGVINLRGEVVTVIDLGHAIGLDAGEVNRSTRNVIIHSHGQLLGLQVDRVSDIVNLSDDEIDPPPSNLCRADERFFTGVCTMSEEILALLNLEEVLGHDFKSTTE